MTTEEFSLEFDILYDNAASKGAPGLDIYDKSVFLTYAQERFIKLHYSGFNVTNKAFETSENRRKDLDQLLLPYETNDQIINSSGIDTNSKFYSIPIDTWYIVWERIVISSSDNCLNGKMIKVKPITHDEYNNSSINPFRKPSKRKVWRVDRSKIGSQRVIEIISPFTVSKYMMRYLKKPVPIVLGNFEDDPETTGRNLTIDSLNVRTESELNNETHRDILIMAVQKAILSYRENNLVNNVQLMNEKIV